MHPRRLARQIARAQLDKAGATGYNHRQIYNSIVYPSYFQRNWKNIAKGMAKRGEFKV